MKTKKPRTRKKHPLLWIALIVVVLLAGAFGLYTQLDLNRPAPVVVPVVARGKIPPVPPSPGAMPAEQPPSQSEHVQSASVPLAAEAGLGSAVTSSRPNIPPSEPVQAATEDRQKIVDRVEPQNPQAGVSPADPEPTAAQTSEPSGSPDSQEPGASPSGSQSTAATQKGQTVASLASDDRPGADPAAPQPSPAQQMESEPARSASPDQAKPQDDAEPPAPFSVQVGAYLTKAYADEMAAQLMGKGYDAYIFQRTDKKQRVWHMVRFGHFPNRKAAAQAMKTFQDQEHMDASVALSNTI